MVNLSGKLLSCAGVQNGYINGLASPEWALLELQSMVQLAAIESAQTLKLLHANSANSNCMARSLSLLCVCVCARAPIDVSAMIPQTLAMITLSATKTN